MARAFSYEDCGQEITIELPVRRETAKCRFCGTQTAIPDSAIDTSENPLSVDTTVAEEAQAETLSETDGMEGAEGKVSDAYTQESMKKDLRGWGIWLIILGFIHFAFAGLLDPVWGAIIIVIGILNLCIQRRGMFIVNGCALVLVGIMNIAAGGGLWAVFGVLQIIWGSKEIKKYSLVGRKLKEA